MKEWVYLWICECFQSDYYLIASDAYMDRSKMAAEYVEATLTSSRIKLELQLNYREVLLNNQLNSSLREALWPGLMEENTLLQWN